MEKGRRRKVKVIGEVAKRSKVGRFDREVRQTSQSVSGGKYSECLALSPNKAKGN